MIYAFAKLDKNKIEFFASNSDVELDLYEKFNDLKNKNPHLTTMISIGGWNEKSRKYSEMAKNRAARKLFIESVLNFLQAHKFDGLEIDWYANNFNFF